LLPAEEISRIDPAALARDGCPLSLTPNQLQAVESGINPGLTLVVGPPGAGKTDVAVEIVSHLYRRDPRERVVVVAHSNAALDDLFSKLVRRGAVDPRHMMRLGAGERLGLGAAVTRALASSSSSSSSSSSGEGNDGTDGNDENTESEAAKAFSRSGRVSHCLSRRLHALAHVSALASSLPLSVGCHARAVSQTALAALGDVGSTCETAECFYRAVVLPLVASFREQQAALASSLPQAQGQAQGQQLVFPFAAFFASTLEGQRGAGGEGAEGVLDAGAHDGCLEWLEALFSELRAFRPLEVLRSDYQRGDYILLNQVRTRSSASSLLLFSSSSPHLSL